MEDSVTQQLSLDTSKLYEKVIVNINDAVLITEAEPFELPGPKILFVNEAFCKMTGYTSEEVIGKTPRILQGLKTDRKQLEKLKAAFYKWEAVRVELINYRKDGTEFAVEFEIVPVANEIGWFTHWISVQREVTNRRQAQDKLEISEAFNRTILESSPDCLKVLDIEGRIQYMNPSAICLMEIDDFSTVKNKYWYTLWGSENEALVKASVEKALTGETAKFTALCHTAKGTLKWWDIVVSPVGEPGKPVQQIIAVSRDITDKKKLDQTIERMATHLKLSTDSAGVGTWSLNVQTQELEWSALHKKMWGYNEHRSNVTYMDWHKLILPEDKELAFQRIEESKVNHAVYDVDYRIKKADDNVIRSIRSVGRYYYNDKGEADTLTGISIDITEQKTAEEKIRHSEERFRTLAETIPQLIWITNEKGEYEYTSSQWIKYSGLDPYVEKTWQQLVHPDDMKEIMLTWKKSLATGKPYQAEARLKNKQGEYLWHIVHGIAIINQEEKIVKWIGSFTDIHQQKINEEKKDEFISIASHEMKTPLTSAKGYLELLLPLLGEENQIAFLYANKANQSVERIHRLVTELLDVSKIQNGKLNYNISTFDFNEMIDEAVEDIQLTAKNHRLQKNGNCLKQINGDKDRLQQVLINLLNNAIKYSPKADKILIKIAEQESNIQVSVQDFGIGMPIQHLDKIFDRYYRAQEHAINFQGLGIGLYISNNIIERHNGKMWAESEPDKGSTFYFTLPK